MKGLDKMKEPCLQIFNKGVERTNIEDFHKNE